MTYKVNLDGSIECSSADEALELQRKIQERGAKAQRQQVKEQQPTLFAQANGQHSQNELIKKLLAHRGTDITSGQMAPMIGAKSVSGVGPKLYFLKKAIPELANILDEQRDDRGVVTWRVKS